MYNNCKYAVKVQLPMYEGSDTFIKNKANYHTRYRWFRTTFFRSIAGLKQGCNLSPLLANIYLPDLHEHLEKDHKNAPILHEKSITSITWADDLLITSPQHDGLQNCIHNKLNTYTQKWGLDVSLKKTRCVIFQKVTLNMICKIASL